MNQVTKYFMKRVSIYLLTLWLAVSFIFILFRLIPGNPVQAFVAQMYDAQYLQAEEFVQMIDMYVEAFGLDQPLWVQYVNFWKELIFKGDIGPSFINFPKSATDLILRRLPWTIGLLGLTTFFSWVLGNLIGAFAGWRQDTKLDKSLVVTALAFSPVPFYLMAIVLMMVFFWITGTIWYGAFNPKLTPGLYLEFIWSVIQHGTLPALSITLSFLTGWIVSMRSLMVPILGEDYLIFAEAKGLKKRKIFYLYAFRNAILPQITVLAIQLGNVMSGSILIENIFNYPGIGFLFNVALVHLDYNTIMGCLIIVVFSVLTANLLIDLLLPFIDPRIKYGG